MPKYLDEKQAAEWKRTQQTDEDRAAIAAFFEEERRVAAGEAHARHIEGTDTRQERATPDTLVRR